MGRLSSDFPNAQSVDAALKRANKAEVDVNNLTTEMSGKVDYSDYQTETQNLQGQINQIVISSAAETVVAPEVAQARVGADGTSYQTLKARLDTDYTVTNSAVSETDSSLLSAISGVVDISSLSDNISVHLPVILNHGTIRNTTIDNPIANAKAVYSDPVEADECETIFNNSDNDYKYVVVRHMPDGTYGSLITSEWQTGTFTITKSAMASIEGYLSIEIQRVDGENIVDLPYDTVTIQKLPENTLKNSIDELSASSTDNSSASEKNVPATFSAIEGIIALNDKNIIDFDLPIFLKHGKIRNTSIDNPTDDAKAVYSEPVVADECETVYNILDSDYKYIIVQHDTDGAYKRLITSEWQTGEYTIPKSEMASIEGYLSVEIQRVDGEDIAELPYSAIAIKKIYNNPLKESILNINSDITKLTNDTVKNNSITDVNTLRLNQKTKLSKITLPELSYLSDFNLAVYSDGYQFKVPQDISSVIEVNSAIHATPETFSQVLSNAESGDTIILSGGVYSGFNVDKSLNIISTENAVIVPIAVPHNWDTTLTQNVYSVALDITPTNKDVVQIISQDYDIIEKLTKVSSSDLVNEGTWYYNSNNNKLYVHLFGDLVPDELNCYVDTTDKSCITSTQLTEDSRIYMKGITVFGGDSNINITINNSHTADLIAVDCKFYKANKNNSCTLKGANGFFQRCEAAYAYLDGFNYHKENDTVSNGLEIDCIAHDNGLDYSSEEPSNNGSTCHDGGSVLRINGSYYNNAGGNIADISVGTVTYCYGCLAYDSKAPSESQTNGDFWVHYSGEMHLYGCKSVGDSAYNLRCNSGTLYYDSKTLYDTKYGNCIEEE